MDTKETCYFPLNDAVGAFHNCLATPDGLLAYRLGSWTFSVEATPGAFTCVG